MGDQLHISIASDQLLAETGQQSPATGLATELGLDDGLTEGLVERVDQQPRAAIGHVHRTSGRRDRASVSHELEQADFAGPDRVGRIKIDAQSEPCHAPSLAPDAVEISCLDPVEPQDLSAAIRGTMASLGWLGSQA